ncbi:diphosphate--fructose-6-phosphate 1-phosphotransferase [Edaphobacter bradus]|uniref:diphosphate--fructose-6-phosphate 1-phosphotransferase n=1 Tax=Edaphobacter bradus TaxID=2259016 RepID=UPI0021E0FB7F|nr:diphosphate--fructose-6-phosphate 1-phosphotransferase [Edaphobacter bradus]
MTVGNLLVVQGGGPTAVLNASLSSIISEASQLKAFGRISGAQSGLLGLVNGDYVDLGGLSSRDLGLLRNTSGAALRTSRYKPCDEDFEKMLGHLRASSVHSILFVGGNGTMRGAEAVGAFCRNAGYELQIIGVPKTIDNDIARTDRSPGFGSAARYIAQSTRDLGLDIRSLPQPVSILETMGRSVGWLAGASVVGKRCEGDAPHLVYLPERPFAADMFLSDLERLLTRQDWAVVVVAEGLRDTERNLVYQTTNPSQFDALKRPLTGGVGEFLAKMVSDRLHIRCRSEKPGLLGRASVSHVSEQDLADAELVGRAGVHALTLGNSDKMVALLPLSGFEANKYDLVDLSDIAGEERTIPEDLLSDGPLSVNQDFISYVSALAGDLPEYFDHSSLQRNS